MSSFLYGMIIVIFPGVVLFGTALEYLFRRRAEVIFAFVLCMASGVFGVLLWAGNSVSEFQLCLMWIPMYQLLAVAIIYGLFLRVLNRKPVAVLFDWAPGKVADRLFFLTVIVLNILLPAIILSQLTNS